MTNPRNFLLNSDYPIDQVVYIRQASYTMGPGTDITIAHGLSFTPLVMLQWSLNSDFSVAYEDNTGPFPGDYDFWGLVVTAEANSTNIILRCGGTASSTTVYVRIFGFQPSDSNADVASTVSLGNKYIVNTDYNYMKLFLQGKTGSIAAGGSATITHNLGFYPHVLVWYETSGTITPSIAMPRYNCTAEITTSQLIFRNEDTLGGSSIAHYRIYYD